MRWAWCGVVTSVALAMCASAAPAATQRVDPNADSPAGVIYEIPLDTGRKDAAPVAAGASGGSRGGNAGGSTTSRDTAGSAGARGDGTSSSGADGSSAASGNAPTSNAGGPSGDQSNAGGKSGELPGGAAASDPSSIHSANGFGSSSDVPGVVEGSPVATDVGRGSAAPTWLLITLAAGVATVVGIAAAGAARPA